MFLDDDKKNPLCTDQVVSIVHSILSEMAKKQITYDVTFVAARELFNILSLELRKLELDMFETLET